MVGSPSPWSLVTTRSRVPADLLARAGHATATYQDRYIYLVGGRHK